MVGLQNMSSFISESREEVSLKNSFRRKVFLFFIFFVGFNVMFTPKSKATQKAEIGESIQKCLLERAKDQAYEESINGFNGSMNPRSSEKYKKFVIKEEQRLLLETEKKEKLFTLNEKDAEVLLSSEGFEKHGEFEPLQFGI